jgi:hypothetical protein
VRRLRLRRRGLRQLRCGGGGYRFPMGMGVLVALTLPGLAVLLVVVATAEHLWSRVGRRSPLYRRERHALSAGGMDVFSAALFPGKAVDLEQQRVRELTRDDVENGAPPNTRIDLDSGVVYVDRR